MSLPPGAELLRPAAPGPPGQFGAQVSGRESRFHKITEYVPAQQLADAERARLALPAYGVTVDRGRLVREAIAVLVAGLAIGDEASLVARCLGGAAGPEPADRP